MQAFLLAVFCVLAGFYAYYRITDSTSYAQWASRRFGHPQAAGAVYLRRLAGVLLFAGPPLIAASLFKSEIIRHPFFQKIQDPAVGYWTLGLAGLLIPFNFLASTKSKTLEVYPQIRDKEWGIPTLFTSALAWIAYLLAYEWLFRGVLFFSSLTVLGFWKATLFNIALYALVHIPKGRAEVIGSIPLGLVLCVATYQSGSIWVAFFTHVVLALSMEWITLYRHPEIQLKA